MENEIKFVHDSFAAPKVLRSLNCTCLPDTEYHTNIINSIYFDTSDYMFAMEKAASDYLKTKIRVRWYQECSGEVSGLGCFLEFKYKTGSKRRKKRIPLDFDPKSLPDAVDRPLFLEQMRREILSIEPELAGFDLCPQILVSYTRYRFKYEMSKVRISLDTGINAKNVNTHFRNQDKRVYLDRSVLEVKGGCHELPIPLRCVIGSDIKKESFSKYYECFLLLSGYLQ